MHEINIFFVAFSFVELLMFDIEECGMKFVAKIADCGQVPVIGCVGYYQVDDNFALGVVTVSAYSVCTAFGRRLFASETRTRFPERQSTTGLRCLFLVSGCPIEEIYRSLSFCLFHIWFQLS